MVPVLRPRPAAAGAESLQSLDHEVVARILRAILVVVVSGFFFGGLSQEARAVPISGAIQFFGSADASGPSGPPTTIDFANNWQTLIGIGVYLPVRLGTPAVFNDFTFVGDGAAALLLAPVAPLWTFTFDGRTYSFDLLRLTNGHTEPGAMSFSGEGIARATGFDDTFATFSLQGAGNNFEFLLSSATTAPVPEAGTSTLLLMGFVLAGSAVVRRKLRFRTASPN